MSSDPRLRRALEHLAEAGRERLARHPLGHLARGREATLELALSLPLGTRDGEVDAAVARAGDELQAEIEALLAHRVVFQPGRVFCLRCASAECEHAAPAEARQIFAGYGASGLPRFVDFGQWLLERQDPRLDRLYQKPPRLVTTVVSGRELTSELLPAFRDQQTDYHIHGQVLAGWFPLRLRGAGPSANLALSFQVVSSRRPAGRRRQQRRHRQQAAERRHLGLNVLGAGPRGEPLAEIYDQLRDGVPWTGVVQWSQSVLDSIELAQGRRSATPEVLSQRIEGLLQGMARRLEQGRRSRDRRTHHAEQRHTSGDRPTRMALRDLKSASDDSVLYDRRRQTLIVLGDRGRSHVFNAAGKLVTSIRYSPDAIERRRKQDIWRPASADEVVRLRQQVGGDHSVPASGESPPPAGRR